MYYNKSHAKMCLQAYLDSEGILCHLPCRLLVILKVIFANSMDPDQTAPLGAV